MGLSTALTPALLLLLLASPWCQGAPVPDAATQVFSGLDLMLTSLGAVRQRRAAGYDKEFTVEDLGVSIGLSYHDPSRKVRGGKLHFDSPKANFVLDIDRDRGVTATDGSFSFDVEYTLNESGETGKFTIERIKQNDGQFQTKISNLPPDTDLVPHLELDATSDFKTKVDIVLSFTYKTHDGKVKIKLDRGTEEYSVDCEFEYNGKIYGVKGSMNKATRTGDLLVVSPQRNYTLKGSIVTNGDTKVSVGGDMMGKVSFVMNIKEGFREAKLQLTHKKAKLLQMKLRGEKIGEDINGEAKWALLGGKVAKGRADASVVAGSATVVVTPDGGRPITVSAHYPEDDGVTSDFGFSATKGGEKLFSYEGKLVRKDSADTYEVGLESDLELREKSLMYSTGCRIGSLVGSGCFKTRQVSASVVIDKTDGKRLSVYFNDIKDGESTLELTLNSLHSPYKVDIVSPQLASTELGSDRMFLVLDYQPRTQLTVETSYKELKLEMRAEKTTEGRQFFVEMWREGVKNINYNLDVQYQETDAAINIHSKSNFDIKPESLLYPVFCSYGSGCFQHRESEVDIFIDNQSKNWLFPKFRLTATMSKDSVEAFSILADTTRSPYRFEMTAPHMLPDLIGAETLEADITHTVEDRSYQFSPRSQLLVESTHPQMKTFEIQSSDDGVFVRENEQLLMKIVNFVGGQDSLEADMEFRNSKKARLNMNWQNKEVFFTIVGDDHQVTGNIQSAEDQLDFDVSGVGPVLGEFVLQQSVQWKSGDILGLTAKGKTETERGLLAELDLSPMKNDIKLDWEKSNWIVNGHVLNHFQGEKYEIVFEDNSIAIDM